MEARSFIPDLVEFLAKRHAAAVALIGSRAEGLSHPVSYDFLCLHAEPFDLSVKPPDDLQPPCAGDNVDAYGGPRYGRSAMFAADMVSADRG